MKTSNYLIALAALTSFTFVSCSDNDFLGDGPGGTFGSSGNGEISFAAGGGKTTRAEITGEAAAKKLGEKFTVYGWKSVDNTSDATAAFQDVFQDYVLSWAGTQSAKTTESNKHGWEYVGGTTNPISAPVYDQTIKYWDWSTTRYDFIGWTIKDASSAQLMRRAVVDNYTSPTNSSPELDFYAPTAKSLADIYVSDKFTSTKNGTKPSTGLDNVDVATHPTPIYHLGRYGDATNDGTIYLQFRNLAAKVRVGIYETIPGYKVSDVVFYNANATRNYSYTYTSDDATDYNSDQTYATLFNASETFVRKGTVTVKYHDSYYNNDATVTQQKDNVAYTALSEDTKSTYYAFGKLTNHRGTDVAMNSDTTDPEYDATNHYIGTTSSTASMSIGNDDDKFYTYVFPMENNANSLELKVNYLLTSLDGSGEQIRVTGANATVPAEFAKWKSNYAYTYLFKVSDNTNGYTSETSPGTPEGLYPIVFDACVVNEEDGIQETITTINNISITTYQDGSEVTKNDEYKSDKGAIYVTTEELADLVYAGTGSDRNFWLYIAEDMDAVEKLTEETAANYLDNGMVFTDISADVALVQKVPNSSGAKYDIVFTNAKKVARFTPVANTVYVVKYKGSTGVSYKVIKVEDGSATQTYTVKLGSTTSAATNEAIAFTVKNGTYNVTGAKSAIIIKKGSIDVTKQFAIAESSSGNYTVTPITAVAGTDYTVNLSSGASVAFTVTSPVWYGKAKYDVEIGDADISTINIEQGESANVTLKAKSGGSGISGVVPQIAKTTGTGTLTATATNGSGVTTLTASNDACGTWTVTYNGVTLTVQVDKYAITAGRNILNVGATQNDYKKTTLTLTNANAAGSSVKNKTFTSNNTTAIASATAGSEVNYATITASAKGDVTFSYEQAKCNVEVVNYVLTVTDANTITLTKDGSALDGATFEVYVGTATTPSTTFKVVGTSTAGAYKMTGTTAASTKYTIKLKYKGVEIAAGDFTTPATAP